MSAMALRKLWIQLTADRKRFGALCAALCVGILLWARLIVVSQPPRTALANPAAPEGLKGDEGVATPKPQGSGPGAGADNARGSNGPGFVARHRGRTPIRVALWATPEHDPFVIDPLYFPKLAPFTDSTQDASKSQPEPVEEPLQTEARIIAQLRALVERLKLEAAIGTSMAVIDGKTYRLGNEVPTAGGSQVRFTLTEVRRRSVILECEGRRFELQMASPGT